MFACFSRELGLQATLTRGSQLTAILLVALVAGSTVAWFLDGRVTDLMLANLVARATDQVELGLVPRLNKADFEPPYTQAKLDWLDSRLDQMLVRVRESASGLIRIDLVALDGTVLYSDLGSLKGQVVSPLANPRLAAALAGSASAEVSALGEKMDVDLTRRYDLALVAYVPCILRGRVVGAYEVYTEPGQFLLMRSTIWLAVGLEVALVVFGTLAVGRVLSGAVATSRANERVAPARAPPLIRNGRFRPPAVSPASECWLSRREMDVLRLLASNRTYREIAGELSVSEETVRSHVKSILHKLGQPDRNRAVAAAVRAGVLPG